MDFEHAIDDSLPFFDIGNLLFSTLVRFWKMNGTNCTIIEYSNKVGMTKYITKWVKHYSSCSGIELELLSYLPALSVIHQNIKYFPKSRDVNDYALFGDNVFYQMIDWKLTLE